MKSFEYVTPDSVRDATKWLPLIWGRTEILAGGTDLVTALKQGITTPDRVVSLRKIKELRGIESDSDGVRIGATTTLAELANDKIVRKNFPALVTAVEGIGSSQIINVGTVGGDLCQRPRCWYFRNGHGIFAQQNGKSLVRDGDNRYHAIFGNEGPALFVSPSSLGPALVALGAELTLEGPDGKTRQVAAGDFFHAPKTERERETALRPNEILTAIFIPSSGLKNATYEVRHRGGLDWPYVTATAVLRLENGLISDARIVLGHVAPVPWVAGGAASVLNGSRGDEAVAARAGEAAVSGARPLSRNGYKVQMVKTAVKRAVLAAAAS
jgi:xanthine dehydrogenase YagS FAD-binding subunit